MDTAAAVKIAPSPAASLRDAADAVFERVSPYPGNGFRNHCRRLFNFASMLMEAEGLTLDRDVAYMIAMWHDLGIVSERDEGANYLRRSWALFQRESQELDMPAVDETKLSECLLYNHRLLPVPNVCRESDCFRRAVIIEHSRGLKRYGLDRTKVKALFEEYPRENFDRVLLDFTWRTIRREPLTLVNGVFF